jgi:acyl-coenzyme A thioesterase PaaI-like protein
MSAQIIRRLSHRAPTALLRWLGNLYPPFLGAGIRIRSASPDFRQMRVALVRSFFNRNYVGTQFGGSIYAMTDPFLMMMILNNLGPEYIVWDKAASIDFLMPGQTELTADFQIDENLLTEIREKTAGGEKHIFDREVLVKNTDGVVVARVIKTIYVRKKKQG